MPAPPSQKQLLTDILLELQSQGTAIAANTAAIQALQSDLLKTKHYIRWLGEYSAGQDPELVDIEAGTHIFPT